MILSEIEYVFFLPAVFALYWLLPRRAVLQNVVLLSASLVFYATWNVRLLPLFLGTTLLDWGCSLIIGREGHPHRRLALTVGLVNNLGALLWFKYAGFFAPELGMALPLGISFYTMARIGYLVDVYDGRVPAERSLLNFATFVAFFPQLIAGPIGRAPALLPQYRAARRLDPTMLARGAAAILLGLVLKAFIADIVADRLVNPVFAAPGAYDTKSHWMALVGYGAQVFSDFAGYSLLAIGSGRLLGIELPQNFNWPFLSQSLPEVWRRWHMSLNNWLFDYIYGPLTMGGGFFRGRLDLGFIVVFLISGLWHGAAIGFVVWGLLHGFGLVVHRRYDEYYRGLCRKDRTWVKRRKSAGYKLAAWALTQGFFFLTLVPFRAPSLGGMTAFTRGLLPGGGGAESLERPAWIVLFALALLVGLHLVEQFGGRLKELFFRLPAPLRGVAYGLVIVFLMLAMPVGAGAFIYAQF